MYGLHTKTGTQATLMKDECSDQCLRGTQRRNFKFYESKNFSDSSLHRMLNSKILGSFFYEKQANLGTEMRKIKV